MRSILFGLKRLENDLALAASPLGELLEVAVFQAASFAVLYARGPVIVMAGIQWTGGAHAGAKAAKANLRHNDKEE